MWMFQFELRDGQMSFESRGPPPTEAVRPVLSRNRFRDGRIDVGLYRCHRSPGPAARREERVEEAEVPHEISRIPVGRGEPLLRSRSRAACENRRRTS
jgi:hypothetical protein